MKSIRSILITLLIMLMGITFGCDSKKQHPCPCGRDSKQTIIKSDVDEPLVNDAPTLQLSQAPRGWPEQTAYYYNVALKHEPFFLQGPFEAHGGEGDAFHTWCGEDALAAVVSPTALGLNIIKLPIDLLITPPCKSRFSRSVYPTQRPVYEIPE